MQKDMGDIENLPDDVGQLKHLVWDYYQQNRQLQDRVALLQSALYAPKSEKSKDLFQGILPLPLIKIAEAKPAEVPVVEIPAHTRTKRGRKPLPDHLPRIEIILDLPAYSGPN